MRCPASCPATLVDVRERLLIGLSKMSQQPYPAEATPNQCLLPWLQVVRSCHCTALLSIESVHAPYQFCCSSCEPA